jgi:hypothetical protein
LGSPTCKLDFLQELFERKMIPMDRKRYENLYLVMILSFWSTN